MGRKFTRVSQEAFKEFQIEAGLILNAFDPTGETDAEDADIVCATTGGIDITCKPNYINLFDDVDNAPSNTLEGLEVDGWDCGLGFTSLGVTAETIKLSLGIADVAGNKITPRASVKKSDAKDIWWVGDRSDGGFVACRLMNALSADGLALKTTKKGKGQLSCKLTGYITLDAQDVVPMEFYVQEGEAE